MDKVRTLLKYTVGGGGQTFLIDHLYTLQVLLSIYDKNFAGWDQQDPSKPPLPKEIRSLAARKGQLEAIKKAFQSILGNINLQLQEGE